MQTAGLTSAEIDVLVRAAHGDPFAVLGPHACEEGIWLRVLVPEARRVSVLAGDSRLATLDAIHPAGLFAKLFEPESLPHDYRLEIEDSSGERERVEDPYRFGPSIGAIDRYLLAEGTHLRPWQVLGAHVCEQDGVAGVRFAVWAPNASRVAVIGDFNDWHELRHPMRFHPGAGLWELFIPDVRLGSVYKYAMRAGDGRTLPHKADPYALASELRPATASVVAVDPGPALRANTIDNSPSAPISIYEVHLGSWRRTPDNEFLDWATLAEQLPAYVAGLGFTHIELLPIAEHPFDGSWGYQVTGMYAPTRRFGAPRGFADFVAACHAHGLGVILDWVPAHFPNDTHALAQFDGTALYEYADPREGLHKDWNTLIFNFARTEVRNYLVGNALYWLESWGVDGLRVDAVASMLYRDYSRQPGEWVPNIEGGRENLEAVGLIQRMNEVVDTELPQAITVAEESTSWPGVTRPVSEGGLGFHFKWNLGWMHDTLRYMGIDPIYRKHHHEALTFGIMYAFDEEFVLALSHDEVVHGKRSLLGKMSGDRWQQFANLRAYFGFMWGHPGKKLLFMGGELAQEREWNHDRALDWHLLEAPEHRGTQTLIRDLNAFYRAHPALYELDASEQGFEWVVTDDRDHSVVAFLRKSSEGARVLVVCNFTPVPRHGYRVGMDEAGAWIERLNTDDPKYGGSGVGNGSAAIESDEIPSDGRPRSISLHLPPLGTLLLEPVFGENGSTPERGDSCPESRQ